MTIRFGPLLTIMLFLSMVFDRDTDDYARAELFTMILISVVMSALALVISELLRPKQDLEDAKPASVGDFNFPTATEQRKVGFVHGRIKVAGPNVVWYGDFTSIPIKEKVKTGLWSYQRFIKGYRYYVGLQMALCQGQVDAVHKVWIGDRLVFDGTLTHEQTVEIDEPELFGGEEQGTGGVIGTLRLHDGRNSQAVNAYLSSFQTPNQPAYRGTAYVVWGGGYAGTSTSIQAWSFEVSRYPDNLSLTGSEHIVNCENPNNTGGFDANPMEVLYEVMTSDELIGLPTTVVNTTNMKAVGEKLYEEGYGYSGLIERPTDGPEVIKYIMELIDGVVRENKVTGLIEVKLNRDDYDPLLIPEITNANLLRLSEESRQSWEGTTNEFRVAYDDRQIEFKPTYASDHDVANQQMQGGEQVATEKKYPGCVSEALALRIAARELRFLSYPLAKATFYVNREFYDIAPGDVVAWTDTARGYTRLPMRVLEWSEASLVKGEIKLVTVQDVYSTDTGFFGAFGPSKWSFPVQNAEPIPTDESVVEEAPKAIADRDSVTTATDGSPSYNRLWVGGRQQAQENKINIFTRYASTTPTGAFVNEGEVYGLFLIGSLNASLSSGDANPTTSIVVDASPDGVAQIVSQFAQNTVGAAELGQQLTNMVKINNEYMLVTSISSAGSQVTLQTVYRGVMDSAPQNHAATDSVFFLSVSMGMTTVEIPQTYIVQVELLAQSRDDVVTISEAPTITLTMSNRHLRPYPPVRMDLNGTRFPSSVSIDVAQTSTVFGFDVDIYRRDYRTTDEIASLTGDDTGVLSSTEQRIIVVNDPTGTPTTLYTSAWQAGTNFEVDRTLDILENMPSVGDVPSTLQVQVESRHTIDAVVYESRYSLDYNFSVTSSLSNDTFLGRLSGSTASTAWTVPGSGSITLTLSLTQGISGAVEVSLNGGTYTNVITGGGTSGTIGATGGDSLVVRHGGGSAHDPTLLEIDAPGFTTDAWAILVEP